MNRAELIQSVATRSGVNQAQAAAVMDALTRAIAEALAAGDDVRLPGLLTAQRVSRPARVGRHPRTGEPIDIPAKFVVKLSPGSVLTKAV